MNLDFQQVRHKTIEQILLPRDGTVDFGHPYGQVSVDDLRKEAARYRAMTYGDFQPQLAMLVFCSTRKLRALDHYAALSRSLDAKGMTSFYEQVKRIAVHPHFDVTLFDDQLEKIDAPELAILVAITLIDIYFYRLDILDWLLKKTRHFWFYTSEHGFRKAGGIAGGCYQPTYRAIQLKLSRLFEGFYNLTPEVAPFIHEFGHMLDHASQGKGLLPGLHPDDKAIFSEYARMFFLRGKASELERYQNYSTRKSQQDKHPLDTQLADKPFPIGHPYVFQNDGEFIAGYLEMFFRNPHHFFAENADLFRAFFHVFRQDPRESWKQDFYFYVNQNRAFYMSGQPAPPSNLTVPEH
jgi:hypothetical protein